MMLSRMARFVASLVILLVVAPTISAQKKIAPANPAVRVLDLRCEYKTNPLGIDAANPRLSWRLDGSERGIAQTAYQLRVAQTENALRNGKPLLWDSGEIRSGIPQKR